jgi:hypothetical protein
MKNIKILAVAGVLGLGIGAVAIAQSHLGGAKGHGPWKHGARGHFTDAASAAEHLAEAFAKIAPFDANQDGQLDATENESVAKAIIEGVLHHTPPNGVTPSAEMIRNHIGSMYALLAPHDANHDGALDATEQVAVKSAMEKGEQSWPDGPRGQHPVGGGGPRH